MIRREIIAVTRRGIFKEISYTNGRWTELAQDQVKSLSLATAALNFRTLPSELVISLKFSSLCEGRAEIQTT
jgi:hypothetical protein